MGYLFRIGLLDLREFVFEYQFEFPNAEGWFFFVWRKIGNGLGRKLSGTLGLSLSVLLLGFCCVWLWRVVGLYFLD